MLHPKKKVCACVRLILVLVGKTRILVLVWGTYYVQRTYVPCISTYVSRISRLPRYVYVDTYVPGLHPKRKNEQNAQHTLRERHTHSATHNAQQRACDNCGQRNRGCSCCFMDRVRLGRLTQTRSVRQSFTQSADADTAAGRGSPYTTRSMTG